MKLRLLLAWSVFASDRQLSIASKTPSASAGGSASAASGSAASPSSMKDYSEEVFLETLVRRNPENDNAGFSQVPVRGKISGWQSGRTVTWARRFWLGSGRIGLTRRTKRPGQTCSLPAKPHSLSHPYSGGTKCLPPGFRLMHGRGWAA